MGPRFDTTLYFECDGTLEVCGPTGFYPDDVLLQITRLEITQNGVTMAVPNLPLSTVAPQAMWETEIPNANVQLAAGPAQGVGAGFFVTRRGGRIDVAWPGQLTLVDGCGILTSAAPALHTVRATFLQQRP